jgi:integrase
LKGKQKVGTGLSEKSVHNIHICLRAALNDAIEDGLLRTNPASKALKPPADVTEMVTWTREELATFLASVVGETEHALYRVAAYTGLRRGELLGLRWSDVKWNLSQLSVQQQLGLDVDGDGQRDLAPVKTSNGRRAISLDAPTLRVLERQQAAQEFERRSWGEAYRNLGLVFCRPDGAPLDPDVVTSRFERQSKAAGLKAIRLHDLRHTHATMLLEAGVDISVVSRRLGHADVGFTARVYTHVTARLQLDAAAKLSAYLEPATGTS